MLCLCHRPDVQLITSDQGPQTMTGVELDDVQFTNPNMEEILQDGRWVDDAT